MSTAVIEAPIEQRALTTVEKARAIVVSSVEQRHQAGEMGRILAGLCKQAEEFFKPMKQKAKAAHAEICTKENSVLEPLEGAKRYLSGQIGAFDRRMEEERRAEEARLQEEERQRALQEASALSQERAIEDAIQLESDGDPAAAEAVLANPAPVPLRMHSVIVQKQVPKTEGVSGALNWKFRIVDESLIPRKYLIVDEKTIGGVVRAEKGKTEIPGIEVYPESGARFRA